MTYRDFLDILATAQERLRDQEDAINDLYALARDATPEQLDEADAKIRRCERLLDEEIDPKLFGAAGGVA